ncbi:MAG: hypothetical protein ACRD0P_26285 [Stackebrandtia sp.]
MSYPPPGGGYPDDGYGQQPQYPQQPDPGGWGAPPPPGGGYPDQNPPFGAPPPPAYDPAQPPGYDPNQPVSGGWSAPASGPPGYGQQPVSGNPMGGPGYPPPMQNPPPRKNNTPIVVGAIVALVALVAVAAVLVVVLGNKDDGGGSASDSGTSATEAPSSQEETSPADPDYIGSLSYADLGYDWVSATTDAEATFKDGWDYAGCTDFEVAAALTDLGCEFAVEVAWRAEDEDVAIYAFFLGMTDTDTADTAVEEIQDADVVAHEEGEISDFDYGQWAIDSSRNIVILTSFTATADVSEEKCNEYIEEMPGDLVTEVDAY